MQIELKAKKSIYNIILNLPQKLSNIQEGYQREINLTIFDSLKPAKEVPIISFENYYKILNHISLI